LSLHFEKKENIRLKAQLNGILKGSCVFSLFRNTPIAERKVCLQRICKYSAFSVGSLSSSSQAPFQAAPNPHSRRPRNRKGEISGDRSERKAARRREEDSNRKDGRRRR
jgi:hypothetical protein